MLKRWLQNLTTLDLALRRAFPPDTLSAIDAAVARSEAHHAAEIRCAIEAALPLGALVQGVTATERAAEVFASLRVWDTAANNGVLVYVLLAEHAIEIVADRGFTGRVTPAEWAAICRGMEAELAAGRPAAGLLGAVAAMSELACRHFPADGADPNELPDRTLLL
jgi:uncharacterized membrane protein